MADRDVLVKTLHDDEPQDLYDSILTVNAVLDRLALDIFVPIEPLAVSQEHRSVVMRYVSGHSLHDLLLGRGGTVARATHVRAVRAAGRFLAAYHEATTATTGSHVRTARADLAERLAATGMATPNVDEIRTLGVARSYGDIHPRHLLVRRDGRIALVDPPIRVKHMVIHRDLARFLDELFILSQHPLRLLRRLGRARWSHRTLAETFLEGYAHERKRPLSTEDRRVIDGCQLYLTQRRLRRWATPRGFARLAWYGVPLTVRRNTLRRRTAAPAQPAQRAAEKRG